jgi:hypothetical protein
MLRRCTICAHPHHDAIDQALVAGQALRDIASHYHLSKSAVAHHKESHAPYCRGGRAYPPALRYANAVSSAFASCRSAVSKPSVNQP